MNFANIPLPNLSAENVALITARSIPARSFDFKKLVYALKAFTSSGVSASFAVSETTLKMSLLTPE